MSVGKLCACLACVHGRVRHHENKSGSGLPRHHECAHTVAAPKRPFMSRGPIMRQSDLALVMATIALAYAFYHLVILR